MTSVHLGLTSTRRHARLVRATLIVDDDVLEAAHCIANDTGLSVGEILSRLARRALEPHPERWARERLPVVVPRATRANRPDLECPALDD